MAYLICLLTLEMTSTEASEAGKEKCTHVHMIVGPSGCTIHVHSCNSAGPVIKEFKV